MTALDVVRARLDECGCDPRGGGDKFQARCPVHDDRVASLSVALGREGQVLLHCHAGCESEQIIGRLNLAWADLYPDRAPATNDRPEIVEAYPYVDERGVLLSEVVREEGKKFVQRRPDGQGGWVWKLGDTRRVPYRLPQVIEAVAADRRVWIVEGEKDVHALERVGVVATCNPGGAGKWRREYSEAFKGGDVVVIADDDEPGIKHGREIVASLAGVAEQVALVRCPRHNDVTDHLAAGGKLDDLQPVEMPTREPGALSDLLVDDILKKNPELSQEDLDGVDSLRGLMKLLGGKQSVATQIVSMVKATGAVLFHDAADRAYATFETEGHLETWPIRSRRFKLFVRLLFYRARMQGADGVETNSKSGDAASATAIADAVAQLEAEAIFDGEELDVHLRVAHVAGAIYIDLGDEAWRAIQITRDGWEIIDNPPVRFRRSGGMTALPEPATGGSLELLRAFVNIGDDDSWRLLAAWLVASVLEGLPCPVLILHGEQGAAKSTAAKVLRALVDPSSVPLRSAPRSVDDLMVSAASGWVVAYDNLSHLEPWLSDAICRLCTGGGLAKRELFTDADELLLDAQRPTVINGIEELATRGDLLDRALMVELPVIGEAERVDEREFWQGFNHAHAAILGGLCDALAGALSRIDAVRLGRLPRMADFARWVVAAEPALGWESGAFMASYGRNRNESNSLAIEASPVGTLLCEVAEEGFEASMTELLDLLNARVDEKVTRAKTWPKNAQGLSAQVKRLAPNLRKLGYTVTRHPRDAGSRRPIIELRRRET